MATIGPCKSCGQPGGWPCSRSCPKNADKVHLYPMGTQPKVDDDPETCHDCHVALTSSDGKGYRDGCDRHTAQRQQNEALTGLRDKLATASARALKAEELLRRARPMLADLVPKFPDAEALVRAIDEIDNERHETFVKARGVERVLSGPFVVESDGEKSNPTMEGIARGRGAPLGIMHVTELKMGWDPDAYAAGLAKQHEGLGKVRHADLGVEFNGTSGPYVVACAQCKGEWRKQSDIPEFCPVS